MIRRRRPPVGPVPDEVIDPVRVIDAALRAALHDRDVAAEYGDLDAFREADERFESLLEQRFALSQDSGGVR